MMIQVLTYSGKENDLKGKYVAINKLHDAQSLDEFDINVIDLRDKNIWRYNGNKKNDINSVNDLKSLSDMISTRQKSKVVIIYPQNIIYLYNKTYHIGTSGYSLDKKCELKDMINDMNYILSSLYRPIINLNVFYENNRTQIFDNEISASFYFNNVPLESVLTKSLKSEKFTTIKYNSVILSTLNIISYEQLINFLHQIHLIEIKEEAPDWVKEEKMFDDAMQLQKIQENEYIIKNAKANINEANENISRNNRYKSILYTSGDELVDVIFEILEQMLGCDLSSFHDIKKEDFNFYLDNNVFIGEIKGITSNVKSINVSQLDVHVQNYLDDHEEDKDKITSLLIIDHQRNRPLSEREPVHNIQINLAKRNGSLIVETITLLKLFEKYLDNTLTREKCIEILSINTGLLTTDNFN